MPSNNSMRRCRWALAGVLAMAALATPAAAEDVRFVHAKGTMGDFVAVGHWIQRYITLENGGDMPRQIKVSYRGAQTARGQLVFSREVYLPPRSVVIAPLGINILGLNMAGDGRGTGLSKANEIYEVADAQTNQRIPIEGTPPIAIRIAPDKFRIVRIGGYAPGDESGDPFKKLFGDLFGAVESMSVSENLTPDRWYGYDQADMIVMAGVDYRKMRTGEVQAILDWVRRGGTMLITGTDRLCEMLDGEIGRAAGVSGLGFHYVSSLAVRRGDELLNTMPLTSPVAMTELCPEDATVLFTANGLPLLTRRACGSGTIFVLAVPTMAVSTNNSTIPAQPKDGSAAAKKAAQAQTDKAREPYRPIETVLREVRSAKETLPAFGAPVINKERKTSTDFVVPATAALNSIAGRQGPPRTFPTVLMLAIAGAVLVVGTVLRLMGRGEWMWVGLIPLTLVTAGVIIYSSTRQVDPERLSYIGMITGTGEPSARVQGVFACGGGNQPLTMDFRTQTNQGIIDQLSEAGAVGTKVEIVDRAGLVLPSQMIEPRSTRSFMVDDQVATAGIRGKLTFGPEGLMGTLTNGLGAEVKDAVIYVNGWTLKLGTVGAKTSIAVGPKDALGAGEFSAAMVRSANDVQRVRLVTALSSALAVRNDSAKRLVAVDGRARLIGYMDQSLLTPLSKDVPQKQGYTLVNWLLDIEAPAAGTPVVIPPGFSRVMMRMAETSPWGRNVAKEFAGRADMNVLVIPPADMRLEKAALGLKFSVKATGYTLAVLGVPAGKGSQQAVELARFDNAGGMHDVKVADADRFVAGDGSYEFRLRIVPASGNIDETQSPWTVESINVTLEGISR